MVISFTCSGPGAKSLPGRLAVSPDEVRTVPIPIGKALVFFARWEEELAECCLLLQAEPGSVVSKDAPYLGSGHPLQAYVNARPWTTNATMAMALAAAFPPATAAGDAEAVDWEVTIHALHCDVGIERVGEWMEPMGYRLDVLHVADGCKDLLLRCTHAWPTLLAHLQMLLIAVDIDHIHWIGRERTIAAIQQALPVLENHVTGESLKQAMASGPYIGQRNNLQNLAEWQEDFEPRHQTSTYLSPLESLEIASAVLHQIETNGHATVIQWMPDSPDLAESMMGSSKVGKMLLVDLLKERLDRLIPALNQSTASMEAKRKLSLVHLSPLYVNDQLKGMDAIVVETPLSKLPAHHHAALEENLFRHLDAKCIIVIQRMHRDFKAWTEAMAKTFDCKCSILVPKISDPPKAAPCALAVFTPNP